MVARMMATKANRAPLALCVYCGARGIISEGVLSYRYTASGENVLCKACWESLHEDWLRACENGEEAPFDSYVDGRIGDVRAIYGVRNYESVCGNA